MNEKGLARAKRRRLLPLAVAVLVCAPAVPAAVGETAGGGGLEVPRDAIRVISGPIFAPGFPRSTSLTNVGDVDRDGRSDLLFTNRQGHGGDAVRSHLVFGGMTRAWTPVAALMFAPRSHSLSARACRALEATGV